MSTATASDPFTPQQRALRATGVGASENFPLVQNNFYGLWLKKTGRALPDDGDSVDAAFGRRMEPVVLDWYRELYPCRLLMRGNTVHMDGHPRVLATPDAVVAGEDGHNERVVEIKCPRHGDDWGPHGSATYPAKHWWQVQQQLAVTGLPEAHLVAMLHRDIRVYTIVRHEPAIRDLVAEIEYFWAQYIDTDTAPPVDSSDACGEHLLRRYPRGAKDTWVEGDDVARDAAQAYIAARDQQKSAELEKQRARNVLLSRIGDRYGARGDWGRAIWAPVKGRESLDWRAIAVDLLGQFGVAGDAALQMLGKAEAAHVHRGVGKARLTVSLTKEDV